VYSLSQIGNNLSEFALTNRSSRPEGLMQLSNVSINSGVSRDSVVFWLAPSGSLALR